MTKTYNLKYGNDKTVADDTSFTTSLSLSKKTYNQIEAIKDIKNIKSRSNVISSAIEFYLSYLTSDNYITDLQNLQRTIKRYE